MTEEYNFQSGNKMIIHLSDRPPIEPIKENWDTLSAASTDIVSDIKAYMAVIDSDENVVVCGALHQVNPEKVVYEGGYIINKKKKRYKKKIFDKLETVACHINEYAIQYCRRNEKPVNAGDLSMQIQDLLILVRRAMPPEPI